MRESPLLELSFNKELIKIHYSTVIGPAMSISLKESLEGNTHSKKTSLE